MIDLHLHLFIKGGYEDGELRAHLHTVELILADIEGAPHILHHRNRHDGRARADQFADLRVDVGDLTFLLGNLHRLVDIGVDLLDGPLGTVHLGRRRHLILHAGAIDRHVVLTLGGLHLGLHRLVVGKGLIALLGTHDALVEEALYTVVGLLGDLIACLRLLEDRERPLDLFLAGAVLGLQLQRSRCTLGPLGLRHLRPYLRGIEDGQGIPRLHEVALLDTEFEDTARYLT